MFFVSNGGKNCFNSNDVPCVSLMLKYFQQKEGRSWKLNSLLLGNKGLFEGNKGIKYFHCIPIPGYCFFWRIFLNNSDLKIRQAFQLFTIPHPPHPVIKIFTICTSLGEVPHFKLNVYFLAAIVVGLDPQTVFNALPINEAFYFQ